MFLQNFVKPIVTCFIVFSALLSDFTYSAIIVTFLVSLLLYFKNEPHSDDNPEKVLEPHKFQIIAHRGGALDAPENTLDSIKEVVIYKNVFVV